MTEQPSPESIFESVLQCTDADERTICLEQACGGKDELRREVESLLAAHAAAGSFLEPLVTPEPVPSGEQPGDRIGRYKLLELIGEGGFGRVWRAEQMEPVKRRLALKIIKPGMDSKEVIARFEAERQALALMDHPNIAPVHDAGATESGRPYFVMELVNGVPITNYCDDRKLPMRERLGLFLQVCQAVQHAHQQAIIHRDLKPSNILVTVEVCTLAGRMCLDQGDAELAREALDKALALAPDNIDALRLKVEALDGLDLPEEAWAVSQRLLTSAGDSVSTNALVTAGDLARRTGRGEESRQLWERVASRAADN